MSGSLGCCVELWRVARFAAELAGAAVDYVVAVVEVSAALAGAVCEVTLVAATEVRFELVAVTGNLGVAPLDFAALVIVAAARPDAAFAVVSAVPAAFAAAPLAAAPLAAAPSASGAASAPPAACCPGPS